jgi:hypothetical protein
MMPRFSEERFGRSDRRLRGERFDPSLLAALDFGRLPKVVGKNPLVANIMEVINQPVYDSASFSAGATITGPTVLFQTPIGQSSKTLAQTNMTKAGQLEQPQKLVIRAIDLWISNNSLITDVLNMLVNWSFVLTVGKKPMLEVPLLNLTAGRGVIATAAAQLGTLTTGNIPFTSVSNGIPDPRSVFTLNQPIVIEGGEGFSVKITPETSFQFVASTGVNPPGNGAQLYVFLDGELYRGVQ